MARAHRGAARPDRRSMCACISGMDASAAAGEGAGSRHLVRRPRAGRRAPAGRRPADRRRERRHRVSELGGERSCRYRRRSTSSRIRWCSTSSPRCATRRRRAPTSAACCARSACCWATTPRATCRWCKTQIETPIAGMDAPLLDGKKLVIVPILRAGLGLAEGMLDLVPLARMGHVGLYRDPRTLQAVEYYFKMPGDISDRDVIVCDPMLATAHSAIAAVDRLKETGARRIKFICILARRARRARLRRSASRRAGVHGRRRCEAQRSRLYCPRPWRRGRPPVRHQVAPRQNGEKRSMTPDLKYLLFSVMLTFVQVLIAAAARQPGGRPDRRWPATARACRS